MPCSANCLVCSMFIRLLYIIDVHSVAETNMNAESFLENEAICSFILRMVESAHTPWYRMYWDYLIVITDPAFSIGGEIRLIP